jgi:hypothetical protein
MAVALQEAHDLYALIAVGPVRGLHAGIGLQEAHDLYALIAEEPARSAIVRVGVDPAGGGHDKAAPMGTCRQTEEGVNRKMRIHALGPGRVQDGDASAAGDQPGGQNRGAPAADRGAPPGARPWRQRAAGAADRDAQVLDNQ